MTNNSRKKKLLPPAALIGLLCCTASLQPFLAQTGLLGKPSITATTKGPNQINLTWSPVANPGYGYLVEIQSANDSRYSAWTEWQPIPAAAGYTCDNTVTLAGATCNISDPAGTHVYKPPTNGIPYWVTDKTYTDPQDGSPAQFIAAGLKPDTTYNFRVRSYAGNVPASRRSGPSGYGAYSDTASATTANYPLRYVSPQGNDASDGVSPSHAWRTLAHAAGTITCGQVLIVMGGSYPSDGIFMGQTCTSQKKAVVLVNAGDTAIITSSPSFGAPTVSLSGTSVVVDGIRSVSAVTQPSTEYDGTISGNHNALLNVEFRPPLVPTFTHYGLMIAGDHNLLYRSYLHDYGSPDAKQNPSGNAGYVLTVYGTAANNNVIWSNHLTRGGHDCSLCKGGCNHNRWLNNIMDGGWGSAWQVVGGPSAHNLFEGNVIKDVGQLVSFYKPSVQLSYGYNTVRRNVSMNAASTDLEISALYGGDTAAGVLVYNNTFYSPMSCIFQSHSGGVRAYDNDVYANNICYKLRGGAINIYLGNTTGRIAYNNMLFIDKTGTTKQDEAIVIWNRDAAGDFQYPVPLAVADTKYNPPFSHNRGLDVDPKFVNEATFDFVLKPKSRLIGAGTSITDPDWGSTTGKVDLGAFGAQIDSSAQKNSQAPPDTKRTR